MNDFYGGAAPLTTPADFNAAENPGAGSIEFVYGVDQPACTKFLAVTGHRPYND